LDEKGDIQGAIKDYQEAVALDELIMMLTGILVLIFIKTQKF